MGMRQVFENLMNVNFVWFFSDRALNRLKKDSIGFLGDRRGKGLGKETSKVFSSFFFKGKLIADSQ